MQILSWRATRLTRRALLVMRRRRMATARFSLVALLTLGVVASGANMALAVDSVTLTASATVVNPGATVDLTAAMPVAAAGTTTQTLTQTIDPTKIKLTGASDITYPAGWTLSYSTNGSTFTTTAPGTSAEWAAVKAVKATGPINSDGPSVDNFQTATGTSTYSAPPPPGNLSGGTSGDGWNVFFSSDTSRFYNITHLSGNSIDCHYRNAPSGTSPTAHCPGFPKTISPSYNSAYMSPTGVFNSDGSKMYVPAVQSVAPKKFGWYCLSITPTGTSVCPFVEGGVNTPSISTDVTSYGTSIGQSEVFGSKIYTHIHLTSGSGLYCFDANLGTACPGSPYAIGPTDMTEGMFLSKTEQVGTKILLWAKGQVYCFDTASKTACWSGGVALTPNPSTVVTNPQRSIPALMTDANGSVIGMCVAEYIDCVSLAGNILSAPPGYQSTITAVTIPLGTGAPWASSAWADFAKWGKGLLVGTKWYQAKTLNSISCYDWATDAPCARFTSGSFGVLNSTTVYADYLYTFTQDPLDPNCLWSVGDEGVFRTFNASSGAFGCGSATERTASFPAVTTVPRMGCTSGNNPIRRWETAKVTTSDTYSQVKLTVKNSNGVVISGFDQLAPTTTSPSPTWDLSSLSVTSSGVAPIFDVSFSGLNGTLTASLSIRAVGDSPELCLRATAVNPCPAGSGPVDNLSSVVATVSGSGSSIAGGNTTNLTADTESITVNPPSAASCGSTLSGRAGDAGDGSSGTAIPGVTVTLLDSSGNPITRNGQPVTTTTDSSGNYSFGRLFPGSYKVKFTSVSGKTLVSSTTVRGATGTTNGATTSAVSCPGGGTTSTIQNGMSAVSGSTVLTRATPTNLVANGDFTTASSASGTVYLFGTQGSTKSVNGISGPIGTISGWTVTGGSSSTYAFWNSGSGAPITPILNQTDGNNAPYVYFGNQAGAYITTTPTYHSSGWSLGPYSITPASGYGTAENPPAISQAISTVVGTKYRLQFLQGYENYGSQPGIAALDVTGYSRSYFKVPMSVTRYTIEFIATSSQTTIKFSSWGHISSATELALDDVIINACSSAQTELASASLATAIGTDAVVNALYTVPAAASSDVSSGAWDTNQTISPLTNDTAASGATLTNSTLKLCSSGQVPPSCSATSLSVTGEGTYTVNANGTVTFDPLPSFNGTASAVTYQVSDSASNVVSSTFQATVAAPVPSSATADATSGVKGATQTVTPQANDTAGSGITFVNSSVKLCAVGVLPPNCTSTSLTTAAGTYSVNATSGVITFTPDASFTGVAPAMTYQVSDSSGQTVSSTYTATVTGVPSTDNEVTSGAWNQSQSISLIDGDTAGYGTTLTVSSAKLCGPSDTAPNCSLTTLNVAGVGTYVVNSAGNVTFTPVASFTGSAPAVTYSVTDSLNQKATGTYSATVASPAAPVALPESKTVLPGGSVSFSTITGSSGLASGTQLQASSTQFVCPVTGATACSSTSVALPEGTWSMNQTTGVASFTAANNAAAGTKTSVSYQVTDVTGQTATALLTPVIPAPPTASPDMARIAQDSTVFISVLGNDVPGSPVADLNPASIKLCPVGSTTGCSLTSLTVAGEGTYTVLPSGVVKFVPVAGYNGTATALTYSVADNLGQVATSSLQVTVVPPPFPIALPDTGSAPYGQTVTFSPWLNDAGGVVPAGQTEPAPSIIASSIKLCAAGQAAPNCTATSVTTDDGTYVLNPVTGQVVFTPVTGFTGTATSPVTYQISNNWTGLTGVGTATAILIPTIAEPGTPIATNDTYQTSPLTSITVTPVTNDVAGMGTLQAGSIRFCGPTDLAPACTLTNITTETGTFGVNIATGEVTFTPNSAFDETHPGFITYVITDSLNKTSTATITITDPPTPTAAGALANLAYTGMNTLGGPLPFTGLLATMTGIGALVWAAARRNASIVPVEQRDTFDRLNELLALRDNTTTPTTTVVREKYDQSRPD